MKRRAGVFCKRFDEPLVPIGLGSAQAMIDMSDSELLDRQTPPEERKTVIQRDRIRPAANRDADADTRQGQTTVVPERLDSLAERIIVHRSAREGKVRREKCQRRDSNSGHVDYDSTALTN